MLKSVLEFLEYSPVLAPDCKQWRKGHPTAENIQAVILGDCGSDKGRTETLYSIKQWAPQIPVLLLVDKQRDAPVPAEIAAGVLAQVELPVRYPQLSYVMQQAQIYRESHEPASSKRPLEVFRSLVGNSRAIAAVRKLIERVANSGANVLILGESGTGK
ncbi:MAG: sigma-54-dependent Fis family transcriptional regulator, partial [Gammaproteobacteria bacterium]